MPHDYDEEDLTTEEGTDVKSGSNVVFAVLAAVVALALAVGGWLLFNKKDDTPSSVADDIGNVLESTGENIKDMTGAAGDKVTDMAAEVPQAASDAVTGGDQPTTRPNEDNSKDQLDQK